LLRETNEREDVRKANFGVHTGKNFARLFASLKTRRTVCIIFKWLTTNC